MLKTLVEAKDRIEVESQVCRTLFLFRIHRSNLELEVGNMAKQMTQIQWFEKPQEHDYPAAMSYLSLIYDVSMIRDWIKKLRRASVTEFKAKDIFRASGLSLLGVSNSHLRTDQRNIRNGKQLSPLLLVREPSHGKVLIADGYHRLCAVYTFDEDASIPCKIA
jgi:hypothetical protein